MKRLAIVVIAVIAVISLFVVNTSAKELPCQKNVFVKQINPDGSIPKKWDLPKPNFPSHPDVPMSEANMRTKSGGDGDGINQISFGAFDNGDIIVGTGTVTGHAGEWDDSRYSGSLSDYCIWSANKQPLDGVQLEQPQKYRNDYDAAYGLWVPDATSAEKSNAIAYCEDQEGEPYELTSLKTTETDWYCSKLCWASYWFEADMDLDGDGGLYVWPVDLINDDDTSIFEYDD